ncbi:unnamed protein product [Adineta ricciae]|uniref:AAA+ ATPase domain-containing protein n=1 Tax=Adineta ricciae TaxID=249248 RepID=A0A814BC00_ADIRI|nr:unnamed protein product [Adineta ricciae]CAF1253885.1 unnamed protein product [Adineta ricciae]
MAQSTSATIRHILITGEPGAGKTTLLRRVCETLLQQSQQLPCYGFYTEEVRGNTRSRIGFDVVTLDGKSHTPLARTNEHTTSPSATFPRIGQYNVFVDEFERVALPLITDIQTPCICFIDEIGKMELLSSKFKRQIQTLLDKPNMILIATIPIKSVPCVDTIRRRKDCHLITVTRENRFGMTLRNELMIYIEELKKDIS